MMELLIFLLIVGIAWGANQNSKESNRQAVRELQVDRLLQVDIQTRQLQDIERQIAEAKESIRSLGYDPDEMLAQYRGDNLTKSIIIPDTFPRDWTRDRTS